jgi:ADP-ribose pyrophosphatase
VLDNAFVSSSCLAETRDVRVQVEKGCDKDATPDAFDALLSFSRMLILSVDSATRRQFAMPRKVKALKPAVQEKAKAAKKPARSATLKTPKQQPAETARVLSSSVAYDGPLFRVMHDKLIEPNGKHSERDVIRHNGSVVILAIDNSKSKKDPWVVMERQYRHAANQFLWELPAGSLEAGEDPLAGAQRELEEETGYRAKKWRPLIRYYASPGFLGEWMKVFVAEGLIPGHANPEEDEDIELRLVKLSELVKMIGKGAILDGKTLISTLLYARQLARKHKK